MSKTKTKGYRGPVYWETEQPQVADTKRIRLSYYSKAGKLQVSQLWPDKDGSLQKGKTVTLDQEDLALNPGVLELLEKALEEWK